MRPLFKRSAIMMGLIIFVCSIVLALPIEAASDRGFTKTTLKNGLKVIYKVMKNQPRVSINVVFPIGMNGEKEKGIAHLLEHLVFRGGAGYHFNDIADITIRDGGEFSGFTFISATAYTFVVPLKNLDTALKVFNSSIWQTDFSETNVNLERKIVLHELDMDYSERYSDYPVYRYFLPDFSYNVDTMAAIKPADVQNFHRTYYQPENATYVLVGNFEPKVVLAELEKVSNGDGTSAKTVITPHEFDLPTKDVEESRNLYPYQYQVMLSYQFSHMPEKDRLVLKLLGEIYGSDYKINYQQNEFDLYQMIYRHIGDKDYFGIYYLERDHPLDSKGLELRKANILRYFREFKKIDLARERQNLAQMIELEESKSQESAISAAQYEVNCLVDPDAITPDTLSQMKDISEKDLERVVDQYFNKTPQTWILVKTTKSGGKL